MSASPIKYPILVISYNDEARSALVASLEKSGVPAIPCSTFNQAEETALEGIYNGVVVDLQSTIKAKGDEKIIACSLTGFFPTLRVRVLGTMLVPMAMPGEARQESTIADFLARSCSQFIPRKLRFFKRREVCISALIHHGGAAERCITVNVSWGGAFFLVMTPETMQAEEEITVTLPEFEIDFKAVVCSVRPWGKRQPPGIGVRFDEISDDLEQVLMSLLKHDRDHARDRMVA